MKTATAIWGMICAVLITIGTLFKLMHWPGAGPLLLLGMMFFSFFFVPLFFIKLMIDDKSTFNRITYAFAMVSVSSIFTGILFKIMHWPGAGLMIVLGTTLFLVSALPLYAFKKHQEEGKHYKDFIKLIFFVAGASIFLIFYGLGISRNILNTYITINSAVEKSNRSMERINNTLIKSLKESGKTGSIAASDKKADKELSEIKSMIQPGNMKGSFMAEIDNIERLTSDMLNAITEIKNYLIQRNGGYHNNSSTDYYNLIGIDNIDTPAQIMLNEDAGLDLKNKLKDYKDALLGTAHRLNLKVDAEELGIDLEAPSASDDFNRGINSWELFMFAGTPIAGTLTMLTSIENEVLNAENVFLNKVHAK